MGASETTLAVGTSFARITLGGCTVVLMLFLINAGVSRRGETRPLPCASCGFPNSINLILDPCLIFGIDLSPHGVMGAAVATLTGRSVACSIKSYRLRQGR